MEQENKQKTARKVGGLLFVGCMFIGMAIGQYIDNVGMGTMGGMGVGFIMMAVVWLSEANKR